VVGAIALTGGFVVESGQTLTISTGNDHIFSNTPVTNHGTVTWTGGNVYLQGSAVGTNASDGLWDAQADLTITSTIADTNPFTNAGVLRKSSGVGALILTGVPFVNTGTIDLQSGQVQVSTSLQTSGLLSLASSTTFFADHVTLQTGSTFSGTGTLNANGTTTVTGSVRRRRPARATRRRSWTTARC
jgi:hypothetical protein